MYDVHFFSRDGKGREIQLKHVERVFCDGEERAIALAFRRVPAEILRRPVHRAVAYRDMRRNR
jgi:hypothetical protein